MDGEFNSLLAANTKLCRRWRRSVEADIQNALFLFLEMARITSYALGGTLPSQIVKKGPTLSRPVKSRVSPVVPSLRTSDRSRSA